MSFLKKAIKTVGGIAKKAAPFVGLANPLVGGLMLAGGTLATKGKKTKLLKDVVAPAAAGYGTSKLLGALKAGMPGAPQSGKSVSWGGLQGTAPAAKSSFLSGAGKFLGNLGLGREGGLDLSHILAGAGAAEGLIRSNKAGKRADSMMNEQIGAARKISGLADQRLAETAPMRGASIAALTSKVQAGPRKRAVPSFADTANPFRKRFPMPNVAA
jgi:hypothetical protein